MFGANAFGAIYPGGRKLGGGAFSKNVGAKTG